MTQLLTMYDGVNPASVPAGADVYLGYLNGQWPTYAAFKAGHPAAKHVSISITANADEGDVLDVENGDATPTQAVGWILKRRAAGAHWAAVYCSEATWPAVQEAFSASHVQPPFYIVAAYPGNAPFDGPVLPPGATGHQYASNPGYDVSVVSAAWVDSIGTPAAKPAPPVKPPAPSPRPEGSPPTLRLGSSKPKPWLDYLKHQLGFKAPYRGAFGPRVWLALKRFQRAHNVPVTGKTDPQTWEALG